MSTLAGVRTERLQKIANRWPRSAWDYRGLARWQSLDESFWTSVLAAGIFLVTSFLDLRVFWNLPLPIIGDLGGGVLAALLLVNGWILDRFLTARLPTGLREVHWWRAVRSVFAAIPLLGLAIFPLWQRLCRCPPTWAFIPRPKSALHLEGELSEGSRVAHLQARIDIRLRTWSQRRIAQIPWTITCQIAPLFSGIYLISRQRTVALVVCVILHLAGFCAALAHVALRTLRLQMTGRRAFAFRLLPLAVLLPLPFSFIIALLWIPASEERNEQKGVIETTYRIRIARRHPLTTVRMPRLGELSGAREDHRRQAVAGKIFLLVLESAALSGLMTTLGAPLSRMGETYVILLLLLPVFLTLPGLTLLLAGAAGRMAERWPRLAALVRHPSGVSLTLVPLAFLFGLLGGWMAALGDQKSLAALLQLAVVVGGLTIIVVELWLGFINLFFDAPERSSSGRLTVFFSFVLLAVLYPLLAQPPVFLGITSLGLLASPFAGIVIAARWLAPFQLRDLKDPRLPMRLRALLGAIALTAVLPLGGLALPWWGQVRHRRGMELDRWAARLREPRV